MGKSSYKRARLRSITGRWPGNQGSTPGRAEREQEVPPPEKPWLAGNEIVDAARSRHSPKGARKRRRVTANTRRGEAGGDRMHTRGRKHVIQRH